MIEGVLRMLLGLGGMFLALGVIVLAVRIGGGTMGLRCGLVMFRRFVVCLFHLISRCWSRLSAATLPAQEETAISGPATPEGWNKPRGRSLFLDHA
jgi:hypothetical protein